VKVYVTGRGQLLGRIRCVVVPQGAKEVYYGTELA